MFVYVIYLTKLGLHCGMRIFFFFFQLPHVGSNFLIRNGIWAPCIGCVESQPLDYQGIPVETTVDYKTSSVISVPTSQTSVS